jgi:hypothetical protein
MKKFVHKLTKNKGSHYLVIPKEIIEKYGYRGKQKMQIKDKGRGVIEIKDWRKR